MIIPNPRPYAVSLCARNEVWKQEKLGDITERITRKNTNLSTNLPLTISAEHGLIDQSKYYDRQIASQNLTNYYLIKKGEFAYNKSYSKNYPVGTIKRLENYNKGALSTLYILFKAESNYEDYLAVYFESDKWHREITKIATEGARNHGLLNISPKDFFEIKLNLPSLKEEMNLIFNLLNRLNQLITLEQKKIDLITKIRAYIVKNLYTDSGKPYIRFKGFNDVWKQGPLIGLCLDIGTGKSKFNIESQSEINCYPILGSTSILGYSSSYDYDGSFLLMARVGSVGELYEFSGKVKISDNTIFIKSKYATIIKYALSPQKIRRLSFGSSQQLIKSSELKQIKIYFPQNEAEVIKLTHFLLRLQKLINQENVKYLKYVSIKNYLLNALFT